MTSKYNNDEIKQILTELLEVLEAQSLDRALINGIGKLNLSSNQRELIAEKCAQVLLSSIDKA